MTMPPECWAKVPGQAIDTVIELHQGAENARDYEERPLFSTCFLQLEGMGENRHWRKDRKKRFERVLAKVERLTNFTHGTTARGR